MQTDSLNAYRSLKLTRDGEGALVAQFHSRVVEQIAFRSDAIARGIEASFGAVTVTVGKKQLETSADAALS